MRRRFLPKPQVSHRDADDCREADQEDGVDFPEGQHQHDAEDGSGNVESGGGEYGKSQPRGEEYRHSHRQHSAADKTYNCGLQAGHAALYPPAAAETAQ